MPVPVALSEIDGALTVHAVAGTHYNLVQEPWVEAVIDLLRDWLAADPRAT